MVVSASGLSNQLLRLTEGNADDGLRLQAHHSAWSTSMFAGEPAVARDHCEAGRQLYDPERHRSHRLLFGGHDPGVCAFNTAGQIEWLLGYPDTALASGREGLVLAERIAGAAANDLPMPVTDIHPISLHRFHKLGVNVRIAYGRIRDRLGL